jgi:hypothetical protein
MTNEKEDFNGYSFNDKDVQKRIKYVLISEGDLDINNAYGIENEEELLSILKNSSKSIAVIKVDKFIQFTKTTEEIVKVELEK